MAKVLCITGMHRSGTSLTASWIQQCGLQIDDGNLIGAAVGNELGHFEDADFVKLHSRYLTRIWPASKNWIVKEHREIDRDTKHAFMEEAIKLIEARNNRYEFWGWKDPRSVIFLDIWKELIPNLKSLLIWREGTEVVGSLVRRSRKATHPVYKIGAYTSFRVWKFYNERMLSYYEKNPDDSILVNIRDIVHNDHLVIQEIVGRLNLDLKHSSIRELVQDNLLRQESPGIYLSVLRNIFGVDQIETILRDESFNGNQKDTKRNVDDLEK